MDVGASVRTPLIPPLGDATRLARAPAPDLDATEIASDRPVRAKDEATPVEAKPAPAPSDTIERNLTVDIETRKVVFQAIDERTGDILVQYPDPRYLKAYLDQIRAADGEEQPSVSVERVA